MYPGTQFNIIDQSALQVENEIPAIDNRARFFVVSSFDKGPENLREVEGNDFVRLYGTPLFSKHGQNGIQAQNIINAGGVLVVKRVVANDSTLANSIICANVSIVEEQKVDSEGNPIYLDEDGNETTEVTDNPVMLSHTSVKWTSSNISNCKSFDEVQTAADNLYNPESGVYPVFIYTDNGRGVSSKAVRLIPDYNTSKGMGKMFYNLKIYEGTSSIESSVVTFDPDVVYNSEAFGIDRSTFQQIESLVPNEYYTAFVKNIATNLSMTEDEVRKLDLIFGYDCKGTPIPNYVINSESIDLNNIYGIELKNGSNGAFGDAPVNTTAWTEAIRSYFAGEVSDEIWDLDSHKIAVVADAAFPISIKQAIASFVSWRKDCCYFRDFGVGLTSYAEILEVKEQLTDRNYLISDYATSYTIKDPTTKKNIEVTMMYDFVECLVNHFNSSPSAPCAGAFNGFYLKNAIKGTVNFVPTITPYVNQKSAFEDLKINYAIFQEDSGATASRCIVQSCYTSQEANTELSYCNNVISVQEIMRAIRKYCPRQRYMLGTGTDLSNYAKAVNNLLDGYRSRFYTLNFIYTEDKIKSAQKIFYASLEVSFNQWAQAEIFDIYVLNSANLENN